MAAEINLSTQPLTCRGMARHNTAFVGDAVEAHGRDISRPYSMPVTRKDGIMLFKKITGQQVGAQRAAPLTALSDLKVKLHYAVRCAENRVFRPTTTELKKKQTNPPECPAG